MVSDGDATKSKGRDESNKQRTKRNKKQGDTNLGKDIKEPCQCCGLKEWEFIDVTQPDLKWHICRDCITKNLRPLLVNEPVIEIIEQDQDFERKKKKEDKVIENGS